MHITRKQVAQAIRAYLTAGNTIPKAQANTTKPQAARCPWCLHPLNYKPKPHRKLCKSCAAKYMNAINTPSMLQLKEQDPDAFEQQKQRIFKEGCRA